MLFRSLRNLLTDACFRRGGRNCVNLTQFLLNRFFDSNRILVVAVSTGFPMLHTVLLSNEELLLLWREVSLSQLVLADPCEDFFSAFKRKRYGGERDFGISINNNQEGDSFCCHPLDYYLLFPRFGFLSDIYNLELV